MKRLHDSHFHEITWDKKMFNIILEIIICLIFINHNQKMFQFLINSGSIDPVISYLEISNMSYFCNKCKYNHHKEWVSICCNCIKEIKVLNIRLISQIENIKKMIRYRLNLTKLKLPLIEVKL